MEIRVAHDDDSSSFAAVDARAASAAQQILFHTLILSWQYFTISYRLPPPPPPALPLLVYIDFPSNILFWH